MGKPPLGEDTPMADGPLLSGRDGICRPEVRNHIKGNEALVNENAESTFGNRQGPALSKGQRNISALNVSASLYDAQGDDAREQSDAQDTCDIRRAKSSKRRNQRPGRVANSTANTVKFPPKPNRSRQGLAGAANASKTGYQKKPVQKPNANPQLYAALDLGTNNCRLLVATPQQRGRFRVVDAFSRIVRLGKGLEKSGRLDDDAMDRTVEALLECAKKIRLANTTKIRLIATEACRRAANGKSFLDRVKRETGLDLEIVNRKTEAALAAEGCGALVDKKADGAVLFDIGGGSSELILLDRRGRKGQKISKQISSWTSLPVGVVTLSERHGGKHVTRQMFEDMVSDVDNYIAEFEGRNALSEFWQSGRVHLLGTSGTVTTVAGVHLKLQRYDRQQVDGIWLTSAEIDKVIEELISMDFERRAQSPCIGRERADLVLAGCAILQSIRKTWPSPKLRVADRGLREGLLTQMMNRDAAWMEQSKPRKKFYNRGGKNNAGSGRGPSRRGQRDG